MSSIAIRALRPLHSRISVAQLSVIVRYVKVAETVLTFAIILAATFVFVQQVYLYFSERNAIQSRMSSMQMPLPTDDNNSISSLPTVTVETDPTPQPQAGPTSQELQAALDAWSTQHPSLQTSAAFQEVGGQGRSASLRSNQLMPTASIYKLFLSAYLYNQIETGAINPSSQAVSGKTITQCIEAMLVKSDNACAEAVGSRVGWNKLHTYIKSVGLTSTVLNVSPLRASSADTALFLQNLHNGELINPEHTAEMLGYMNRQIMRGGIPSGFAGSSVSDRVGYTGGVWNDAAIIKNGDATYVLTVFTSSNNPAAIKDLASRLNSLLQPAPTLP